MALEDVVEGWIEEYEQSRSSSLLYRLVSSSIRLMSVQTGNEVAWRQLLDTISSSSWMTKSQKPHKLILAYLQWRLPLLQKVLVYPELKPDFIVDELEVMLYASGLLPRIVNGEQVYVKGDEQIELMSFTSAKVGGHQKEEREDTRFYRLVMRVAQRHYRDVQNSAKVVRPSWNSLLFQVSQFPPLKHLHFPQDYTKEEEEESKADKRFDEGVVARIKQYMKGVRAVQTASGQVYIEPLKNFHLLSRPEIEKGADANLQSLLGSVRNAAKKRGGPIWGDYLDHVGALDDVVEFHYGIALNRHIIVGHPAEEYDYNFTKRVVLGIIPVNYKGEVRRVQEAEDLHMLIGFRRDHRSPEQCPEELIPLFRRAQSRYEQETGKSPTQLLNTVLADESVVAKYGRMTAQDIYVIWAVHQFKEFLRPRVIGELPFSYNGEAVWIKPGENLHVLRPELRLCDPELARFNKQMMWYKATRGIGYWEGLEQVLAEQAAVNYHNGKALTRQDISPPANPAVAVAAAVAS